MPAPAPITRQTGFMLDLSSIELSNVSFNDARHQNVWIMTIAINSVKRGCDLRGDVTGGAA
jgi:hypothetical protein